MNGPNLERMAASAQRAHEADAREQQARQLRIARYAGAQLQFTDILGTYETPASRLYAEQRREGLRVFGQREQRVNWVYRTAHDIAIPHPNLTNPPTHANLVAGEAWVGKQMPSRPGYFEDFKNVGVHSFKVGFTLVIGGEIATIGKVECQLSDQALVGLSEDRVYEAEDIEGDPFGLYEAVVPFWHDMIRKSPRQG